MDERKEKLTGDQLKALRLEGLSKVQLGAVYQHEAGDYYVAKDVAIDEVTLGLTVLYSPLGHPEIVWVRRMSKFLERFKKHPLQPIGVLAR